jgi:uncharacterized membrane protein
MKKKKQEPSLAGIILLVAGMVLLAISLMGLLRGGNVPTQFTTYMIVLFCAGLISLAAGAVLSGRKKPRKAK